MFVLLFVLIFSVNGYKLPGICVNTVTVLGQQWLCSGWALDSWSKGRTVAGSTPGRGAIKSTRWTQPSVPPG